MMATVQKRADWVLFIVYSFAIVTVVWNHEMWRDELQPWGIGASSKTFSDLIHNIRYEGHPIVWFVMVWVLTKFADDPIAIQILHTCLVLTTAYLIVFRSPFSLLEKTLILFSYYFLYEYAAVSRNYQIGVLLLCIICVLWKDPHDNLLKISSLLFLLVQTNGFAFLIGTGLSVGLLVEEYNRKSLWPLTGRQISAAFIILVGMYLTSLSVPPADSSFLAGWTSGFSPGTIVFAAAGIAHGFLPITGFDVYNFWNFSFVPFGLLVKIPLGLILLTVAYFSMPKDRVALIILCSSILFIFIFTYLKPRGQFRHFGHYTIVLLIAFWIQGNRTPVAQRGHVSVGYFGICILLIQVLAGVNAWYRDVRYPFSMSRSVATYIKDNYPKNIAVAGVFQDGLTAVRWYLQKPIFYLETQEYGSYVIFNKKHWNDTLNNQTDSVTYARYVAFQKMHSPSLLIMSYHSHPTSLYFPKEGSVDTLHTTEGNYLFTCTKKFEGAITFEDYYLFDVKKQQPK